MGVVYRARQMRLARDVALKVITPELAEDVGFRERFERESRVAASIDHPHVIPIYEAGDEGGILYIVMRYVAATDLGALIAHQGGLEPSRAVRVFGQIGDALDAAHSRGLVHRDVKPANILIAGNNGRDHAYLTDFGLTKHAVSRGGLTGTGQWVGTVDYVAPEQIEGRPVDARTDVYALGCVMYEALSGEVPYPLDSDMAKMWAHANREPPTLKATHPELAGRFDPVIARAMAKSPADRHPSAGDLGRHALATEQMTSVREPERSVARGAAAPMAGSTVVSPGVGEPEPHRTTALPRQSDRPETRKTAALKPERRRLLPIAVLAVALLTVGIAGGAIIGTGTLSSGEEDNSRETMTPDDPADQPSSPPADRDQPSSDLSLAYSPYSFEQSGVSGYRTEAPSDWRSIETEPNPGQRYTTEFTGPDGSVLLLDYTPFEPPGTPVEGDGLTILSEALAVPVGSVVADKYVFTGGNCPGERCVDYLVTLPDGGGLAVLGAGPDLPIVEEVTRHAVGELVASGA